RAARASRRLAGVPNRAVKWLSHLGPSLPLEERGGGWTAGVTVSIGDAVNVFNLRPTFAWCCRRPNYEEKGRRQPAASCIPIPLTIIPDAVLTTEVFSPV